MLTDEGIRWLAGLAAGTEQDPLIGGSVRVTDGEQHASAPINEVLVTDFGFEVTAVFPEEEGNFVWVASQIISQGGTVIDSATEDGGRKAQGSVWTLKSSIELRPDFELA